jgi:hypothetical protein
MMRLVVVIGLLIAALGSLLLLIYGVGTFSLAMREREAAEPSTVAAAPPSRRPANAPAPTIQSGMPAPRRSEVIKGPVAPAPTPDFMPAAPATVAAAPVAHHPAVRPQRPLFSSGPLSAGRAKIDLDITGATTLWLVVGEGGKGIAGAWADWAEPRIVGPAGEIKLTSLPWASATTGWGQTLIDHNCIGGPLRIGGKSVAWGIGTHARSEIVYLLPPGFRRFICEAGLDNGGSDQGRATDVQFLVYADTDAAQHPSPEPKVAPANEPAVVALNLVDTRSRKIICPLTDGSVLSHTTLPYGHFTVRAEVTGPVPGSVRFSLDERENDHTERGAPWYIRGDDGANIHPWKDAPTGGQHTLTITPYAGPNATGPKGRSMTVRFTVIER